MPWRIRARWEKSPEFACCRSPECHTGRCVLDFDQWRCSARHAGMVQIAGAAALATCFLHQIARSRFFGGGGCYEESLAKSGAAFPHFSLAIDHSWLPHSRSLPPVSPLARAVLPLLRLLDPGRAVRSQNVYAACAG